MGLWPDLSAGLLAAALLDQQLLRLRAPAAALWLCLGAQRTGRHVGRRCERAYPPGRLRAVRLGRRASVVFVTSLPPRVSYPRRRCVSGNAARRLGLLQADATAPFPADRVVADELDAGAVQRLDDLGQRIDHPADR